MRNYYSSSLFHIFHEIRKQTYALLNEVSEINVFQNVLDETGSLTNFLAFDNAFMTLINNDLEAVMKEYLDKSSKWLFNKLDSHGSGPLASLKLLNVLVSKLYNVGQKEIINKYSLFDLEPEKIEDLLPTLLAYDIQRLLQESIFENHRLIFVFDELERFEHSLENTHLGVRFRKMLMDFVHALPEGNSVFIFSRTMPLFESHTHASIKRALTI